MSETAIRTNADLQRVTDRIEKEGCYATSLVAVMAAVPLDGIAPKVLGLYPSQSEDGAGLLAILDEHREALQKRGKSVVAYATDGGKSERGAQGALLSREAGKQQTEGSTGVEGGVCRVHVADFGITLEAPIVDGAPLIMVQDLEHARKTFRNNLSSGSRLMDLGLGVVSFEILLRLFGFPGHGLARTDLLWVDKQDDGAALRLFHSLVLAALIVDGKIRTGMEGLFVLLFVFGELFDAWLNRTISHEVGLLNAWRAFFFLKSWRQNLEGLHHEHPSFVDGGSSLSYDA